MVMSAAETVPRIGDIHSPLESVCSGYGLHNLSAKLEDSFHAIQADLAALEPELSRLASGDSHVERSVRTLLSRAGKRLRPVCVLLAARVGGVTSPAARELAIAAELVHSATLLHDDVVDLANVRRGAPAARAVYGNAVSIFAGDWLLVQALARVRRAEVVGLLDDLLVTIEEMILAESLQLEGRGRLELDIDRYFRVIEGKTAALFRWAMRAGARAGGLDDQSVNALDAYGRHLGVAFQLIDDTLDYAGEKASLGKEPFADLAEGKMTYPLLIAATLDPSLPSAISAFLGRGIAAREEAARLRDRIARPEVIARCREAAVEQVERAQAALSGLPQNRASQALHAIAHATIQREV